MLCSSSTFSLRDLNSDLLKKCEFVFGERLFQCTGDYMSVTSQTLARLGLKRGGLVGRAMLWRKPGWGGPKKWNRLLIISGRCQQTRSFVSENLTSTFAPASFANPVYGSVCGPSR